MINDTISLNPLKSLKVIAIVDNETGDSSSPCSCMLPAKGISRKSNLIDPRVCTYTQETALLLEHHDSLPIGNMCQAAHGLSLLLVADYSDNESKYLLFDAGPNPELWKNNASRLHIPLQDIDAVVLSHYHIDHSGGLRSVIPEVSNAKGQSSFVLDMHPNYVASRGIKIRGKVYPMTPDNPSPEELESLAVKQNIQVVTYKTGHVLCDGCFYISGMVPRLTSFETGLSGHFSRLEDGNWIPDAEILDERYVACYLEGQGLVIFSACSHAGIINVCRDAMLKLRCNDIAGIVGGLHLAGSSVEQRIDNTIDELKTLQPKLILAGHCTGWRAKVKLATVFKTNYQPLCTGGLYHFKSSPVANGDIDKISSAVCPLTR